MFLWDTEAECLAGAYRMGLGTEIYEAFGIDGFYLQDLFRFEPELHDMMSKSIELGRFYHQTIPTKNPCRSFYFERIVHTTLRFPNHKYLIGGLVLVIVFRISKSLMIEFMKSHYYDPYLRNMYIQKRNLKSNLKMPIRILYLMLLNLI